VKNIEDQVIRDWKGDEQRFCPFLEKKITFFLSFRSAKHTKETQATFVRERQRIFAQGDNDADRGTVSPDTDFRRQWRQRVALFDSQAHLAIPVLGGEFFKKNFVD